MFLGLGSSAPQEFSKIPSTSETDQRVAGEGVHRRPKLGWTPASASFLIHFCGPVGARVTLGSARGAPSAAAHLRPANQPRRASRARFQPSRTRVPPVLGTQSCPFPRRGRGTVAFLGVLGLTKGIPEPPGPSTPSQAPRCWFPASWWPSTASTPRPRLGGRRGGAAGRPWGERRRRGAGVQHGLGTPGRQASPWSGLPGERRQGLVPSLHPTALLVKGSPSLHR